MNFKKRWRHYLAHARVATIMNSWMFYLNPNSAYATRFHDVKCKCYRIERKLDTEHLTFLNRESSSGYKYTAKFWSKARNHIIASKKFQRSLYTFSNKA